MPPPASPPKLAAQPSAVPPPARIRPANPSRPAAPERPVEAPAPPPPMLEEPLEDIPEMVEDEETIAAAPDLSAFVPRVVHKPARAPIYANLFFRRTIIPILLTCGVLLSIIGIWSMVDQNAPLAAIGRSVELLLIVVGIVLFGLGIFNALHVKHILDTAAKQQSD